MTEQIAREDAIDAQGTQNPMRTTTLVAETSVLCALCGGHQFDALAVGYDYELETCCNVWRVGKCQRCGHVQLTPRPDFAALGVIYPPHYYSYDMARSVNRFSLWVKSKLDVKKLARITRGLGHLPEGYLDVGCGDAKYLAMLHRQGVSRESLYGLELDANAVSMARAKGYRVIRKRIEDCDEIASESLDLATMFHVIEHVANPVQCIREVHKWLRPGGVLAIETPNIDALDARLFGKSFWGGYHFPRHWHFFNAQSLSQALADAGFEVSRPRYVPGHSFWMYSVHHLLKYNTILPLPRIARLFDPLRSVVIIGAFTAFDMVRAAFGAQTSSMLIVATKRC